MAAMLADVGDNIGWLTIDNPEKRNAISFDMGLQGAGIIAGFTADPNVRTIVIRGAGDKAFVSGADISQYKERLARPPVASGAKSGVALFDAVRECSKPVIAMIRGYCFGGGVALACACDLRVAASDAVFSVPAAKLGTAYRPAFTQWIVETVGIPATRDILFSARRLGAEESLRIGLINHLVAEPSELEPYTRQYVKQIVDNAPLSVTASKAIIGEVAKGVGRWDTALCEQVMTACAASADATEGNRAFLEKRAPVFVGR